MTIQELKAELRRYVDALAGDEWQLQDGCSWRRIGSGVLDGNILQPTNHHIDGHPDLSAAENVLAYIIKAQPNHIRALLDHVEGLERDARRYRWLVDSDSLERPSVTLGEAYQKYTGGMLDAAIDREMGALAEQGEKV